MQPSTVPFGRPWLKFAFSFLMILFAVVLYHRASLSGISVTVSIAPLSETCKLISAHAASWNTWFSTSAFSSPERAPEKGWNLLHGIPKAGESTEASSIAPPQGCSVDQVHLMSRHAQRYPTKSAGAGHLEFLERVKNIGLPLNGSLAFLNNWTYFTDDPSQDFGQLTRTGPHPGTLAAGSSGVEYLSQYGHLISRNPTRVWASGSQRVIDTARYFASGFFGPDWESSGKAELQIIPETFERGADTLTPSKTCHKYLEDKHRHDHGANMLARFQSVYIRKIANRLIGEGNSGLGVLTNYEVFAMQEMCGSETMVRGSSPWCNVFTEQDWDNFEYARDLRQFYRAGPGNSYSGAMGWLWLDATTTLLNDGPEVGTLFLSFAHSGDIARLLTALGTFDGEPHLPTTHIVRDRTWRTSSVMPMGARITFERLTCSSTDAKAYVRVNINDRIVPLPSCRSGPGGSCPLDEFVNYVRQRKEKVGDFGEVCDLNREGGNITFLHHD